MFRAEGQDGSTYEYSTSQAVHSKDKRTMFKHLKEVISGGFIKSDYWRLV